MDPKFDFGKLIDTIREHYKRNSKHYNRALATGGGTALLTKLFGGSNRQAVLGGLAGGLAGYGGSSMYEKYKADKAREAQTAVSSLIENSTPGNIVADMTGTPRPSLVKQPKKSPVGPLAAPAAKTPAAGTRDTSVYNKYTAKEAQNAVSSLLTGSTPGNIVADMTGTPRPALQAQKTPAAPVGPVATPGTRKRRTA